MKKRVALLYGGISSEHEVSRLGYEYVKELIDRSDYELLPIYVDRSGEWHITLRGKDLAAYPTGREGGSLYTDYGFIRIDAAIPLLHGAGGEDGSVQGALEIAHIPYVGARVSESAVCLDKAYAKAVASSLGIPTLDCVYLTKSESVDEALRRTKETVGLPAFIKPARLGSSVGAYPVNTEDEFTKLYPLAREAANGPVMVESLLADKRELECAFCEINGKKLITPPGEILIEGFYGYGEKYGGKTETRAVADVDGEIRDRLIGYSRLLGESLGLRHLARLDFFLSGEEIYFNEINTFPGFTRESLYPKMLLAAGIDPKKALSSFIEDAIRDRPI